MTLTFKVARSPYYALLVKQFPSHATHSCIKRSRRWRSSNSVLGHWPTMIQIGTFSNNYVRVRKRPSTCDVSLLQQFFFSSSSTRLNLSLTNKTSFSLEEGDRCYQDAMEAFRKHEEQLEEIENQRAKQQYDAMQQALERQKYGNDGAVQVYQHRANRAAGVAVVKAIAKQTRSESKHISNNNKHISSQDDWLTKGHQSLRKAALDYRHKDALVRLGNLILEEANQQPQNEQQYYRKNSEAASTISICLPTYSGDLATAGDKPVSLIEEALLYYEMAGYYGSSEGWYNLGHVLWNGHSPSLNPDKANALFAMRKAIELGDADAMFFVGVNLISDTCSNNAADRRGGLDLVEQSASKGHGGALYWLALLHLNGDEELGIPVNVEKFQNFLDLAALEQEYPDALFLRSHCLYHGEENYMQSFSEAFEGYLKAAHLGHAEAAVNAGTMFYHGVYKKRDLRRAFELYQIGAELGSEQGWRNLAWCYNFGEGVPKCENTAKYIRRTMLQDDDGNNTDVFE